MGVPLDAPPGPRRRPTTVTQAQTPSGARLMAGPTQGVCHRKESAHVDVAAGDVADPSDEVACAQGAGQRAILSTLRAEPAEPAAGISSSGSTVPTSGGSHARGGSGQARRRRRYTSAAGNVITILGGGIVASVQGVWGAFEAIFVCVDLVICMCINQHPIKVASGAGQFRGCQHVDAASGSGRVWAAAPQASESGRRVPLSPVWAHRRPMGPRRLARPHRVLVCATRAEPAPTSGYEVKPMFSLKSPIALELPAKTADPTLAMFFWTW